MSQSKGDSRKGGYNKWYSSKYVDQYDVSVSKLTKDIFTTSYLPLSYSR